MTSPQLACPLCHCPLVPPAAAAAGTSCPRCNTWVEIDPACLGSCLSCHKLQEEHPTACAEAGGVEVVAVKISPGGKNADRP